MDDEPDWDALDTQALAALALGPDVWQNVPALLELGDRSPAAARPVALEALTRADVLLVAAALRVLGDADLDAALGYMREHVTTAPLKILSAMVEVLAVNHPIPADREPVLLAQLVERVWPPDGSREYNLADLMFRQYPQLRATGL
jgi:hypothetical protein